MSRITRRASSITGLSAALSLAGFLAVIGGGPATSAHAAWGNSNALTLSALAVEPSAHNNLGVTVRFRSSRAAEPTLEVHGPEGSWTVPAGATSTDFMGVEHEVRVLGLRPNTRYDFTVVAATRQASASDSSLSFVTGPLPDDFPTITRVVSRPELMEPGYTLFPVSMDEQTLTYLIALDSAGEVVWYHRMPSVSESLRRLENGNFLFRRRAPADLVEISPYGETVATYSVAAPDVLHHQGVELPNGNILGMRTEVREIGGYPNGNGNRSYQVVGDRLLEFDRETGDIVWELSLFDVLDPYRQTTRFEHDASIYNLVYGFTTRDWTHANGMVYDPSDDSVILSLRHQNAVVKIDRASGELVWVIGEDQPNTTGDDDWPFLEMLGDGLYPVYQHAPALLPNGNVMVYDNRNYDDVPTRAVEYQLGPTLPVVREVWSWSDDQYDPPLEALWLGDADPMPTRGTVLVADAGLSTHGLVPHLGHQWMKLQEVRKFDGEKVWEVIIGDEDPENGYFGFDAERIPSLYPESPVSPPRDIFTDGFESGDTGFWVDAPGDPRFPR